METTAEVLQSLANNNESNSSSNNVSTLDVLKETILSEPTEQVEPKLEAEETQVASSENQAPMVEETQEQPIVEQEEQVESVEAETAEEEEEEVLDEDDFIKQRTGGAFNSWEELNEALEAQKKLDFENETSRQVYEMIAQGKIDELAEVLNNKKFADSIKDKSDEDVLKAYIKYNNPDFDADDIEAEYAEKYTLDEYAFDESKLKREQKKLNQRLKSDVSNAKKFFEDLGGDIKLPELTRNIQSEEVDPEFEAQSQEERNKFLQGLQGVEKRINNIPFSWKDDKANLSITGKFEIPAQDLSKYRNAAEGLEDYLVSKYYQDGKYEADRLVKDLYLADNFDKIIQSVISQTANQTRLEILKQRKNITTEPENTGTYTPVPQNEEAALYEKLFLAHKQRQY
jgi:hypothetical protein